MRILQVIPYFTPKRGGSVSVAFDLSIELVKKGHRVTIITSDFEFDDDYAMAAESQGVRIVKFHCSANLGLFIITYGMKRWLKKELKNFDIIHLHNFRSYQNIIMRRYSNKSGVPYILQAHGSIPRIIEKLVLKWLFDLVWGDKILNDASRIIAVSRFESLQLARVGVGSHKIAQIPNGLNIARFQPRSRVGRFRSSLGISENQRLILSIGRIHKIKGIDFLIESFAKIVKDNKDMILVIAGPDDGFLRSAKMLADRFDVRSHVRFVDHVRNVSDAYVDADILVHSAKYEIFGLVPFEAILCETPIIVTDTSGCSDLVREINCGIVIEYGDTEALVKAMIETLADESESAKRVENGKRFISQQLCWERVTEGIVTAYEDCIRNI